MGDMATDPSRVERARSALLKHLRHCDPGKVMFRDAENGAPITAAEMINLVDRCDQRALSLLEDIVAAALRAVRVRTKGDVVDDKETTRRLIDQLERMLRPPRC